MDIGLQEARVSPVQQALETSPLPLTSDLLPVPQAVEMQKSDLQDTGHSTVPGLQASPTITSVAIEAPNPRDNAVGCLNTSESSKLDDSILQPPVQSPPFFPTEEWILYHLSLHRPDPKDQLIFLWERKKKLDGCCGFMEKLQISTALRKLEQ